MISKVEFLPGDGTEIILDVAYIGEGVALDEHGDCAYCHGDPCNESGQPDIKIAGFYARNPKAPTCPNCFGKPT